MKRILYGVFFTLGIIFWLVSMAAMLLVVACERLAHWCWPESPGGNCWTHALKRYRQDGGYLLIRASHSAASMSIPVPHVLWARELPDGMSVEHYAPDHRHKPSRWISSYVLWFRGHVLTEETKKGGQ